MQVFLLIGFNGSFKGSYFLKAGKKGKKFVVPTTHEWIWCQIEPNYKDKRGIGQVSLLQRILLLPTVSLQFLHLPRPSVVHRISSTDPISSKTNNKSLCLHLPCFSLSVSLSKSDWICVLDFDLLLSLKRKKKKKEMALKMRKVEWQESNCKSSKMRTLCDVCESAPAILFCAADEAALCRACDEKVISFLFFFPFHILSLNRWLRESDWSELRWVWIFDSMAP